MAAFAFTIGPLVLGLLRLLLDFIGIAITANAATAAVAVARALDLTGFVAGLQVRDLTDGRDLIGGAFASRNDFLAILSIHPVVFGDDYEPALSVLVPIFVRVLVPPDVQKGFCGSLSAFAGLHLRDLHLENHPIKVLGRLLIARLSPRDQTFREIRRGHGPRPSASPYLTAYKHSPSSSPTSTTIPRNNSPENSFWSWSRVSGSTD